MKAISIFLTVAACFFSLSAWSEVCDDGASGVQILRAKAAYNFELNSKFIATDPNENKVPIQILGTDKISYNGKLLEGVTICSTDDGLVLHVPIFNQIHDVFLTVDETGSLATTINNTQYTLALAPEAPAAPPANIARGNQNQHQNQQRPRSNFTSRFATGVLNR